MKYKITISTIRENEVRSTVEVYVHHKTGEPLTWSEWYNLADPEKKNYAKRKEFTGEVEINKSETAVFEQELENLDVGELAVYINRAR